ncbi:HypC/HybG/HupF family hydrogenase formation chaperone [Clostridium rectalis]|uniref:HypC/HybG/HupF family hydrogenase formation chaperone n=1 Tax=Clostridium rectalis TaxID=2040295 RepID=UPI000F6322D0|nr:HypC/HybG/HupF family hydrogenase formation chaperone [Clostridium rectalis]
MCLSVCGKIKSVNLPFAFIDIKGIETCVNVDLIENPENGDFVLIHAGFAIKKIEKEYYDYLDHALEEMFIEDNNVF